MAGFCLGVMATEVATQNGRSQGALGEETEGSTGTDPGALSPRSLKAPAAQCPTTSELCLPCGHRGHWPCKTSYTAEKSHLDYV